MKSSLITTFRGWFLTNFGIGSSEVEEEVLNGFAKDEAIVVFTSITDTFIVENSALVANINEFDVKVPSNPTIRAIRSLFLHVWYWRELREHDKWKRLNSRY